MLTSFLFTLAFAGAFLWWGERYRRRTGVHLVDRRWFRLLGILSSLGVLVLLIVQPTATVERLVTAGLAALVIIILMLLSHIAKSYRRGTGK